MLGRWQFFLKAELKELRHLVTMALWTDTHEVLDSIQTMAFMLGDNGPSGR